MPRSARVVSPGHPHHVTQRGLGRQRTFFGDRDYKRYIEILGRETDEAGIDVWAYCLMPNHVHLVVTPSTEAALARGIGETNRQYARTIHERGEQTGKFWQGRFKSVALDERHLLAAIRYVTLNPVKAKLVERAGDWRWSSARAHAAGATDGIVKVEPLLGRIGSFDAFVSGRLETEETIAVRRATRSGRPLGELASDDDHR